MEKDSLISVIIPAYNSEKFIANTIQSVIDQTYKDWQLIVVDDCSEDNTVEIVAEFAEKDPRVICVSLSKNGGAAVSRNKGLEKASGRFIAFLDSDDSWYPTKLQDQREFMVKNNYPISFTSYDLMDENGEALGKIINSVKSIDYTGVLKNTIIGMSTSMIDTRIVKKDFKFINIRTRQDLYLWITLLKRGYKAYGMDKVYASYRVRKNSISSNKIKGAMRVWHIYYKLEKLGLFRSAYYFANYAWNAFAKKI
ncbi:glycosyltransferase family 2 protein [Flagellimonas sp. GZD32]|uniref:glycosyltransferase family 2 protein n=1 Tax=Flagellimonas cixiensis TaxID=3228750 RepID=UPI0035C8A49C